jgi:VanZ family protein
MFPAPNDGGPSRPLPMPTIAIRVAGLFTVAAIGVLSLVPGSARPHVAWPWSLEHAAAYLAAAMLLSLGFLEARTTHRAAGPRAFTIAGLLATYGAALEALQHFVPGRTASLVDLCANVVGTILGIGIVLILRSAAPAQPAPKRG